MSDYSVKFKQISPLAWRNPDKLLKLIPKKLTPPKEVETEFTFTYSELELLLRNFGTTIALKGINTDGTTRHTNSWVLPEVDRLLKSL